MSVILVILVYSIDISRHRKKGKEAYPPSTYLISYIFHFLRGGGLVTVSNSSLWFAINTLNVSNDNDN